MIPQRLVRPEDGEDRPYLVWRFARPCPVISTAVLGGGIGERNWVLNAQVRAGYDRLDPAQHLAELAERAGLVGAGVGLLTAADVDRWQSRSDGGVDVDATVGVRVPTWAAHDDAVPDVDLAKVTRPGTINIVGFVPAAFTDGALVNLVTTATEAKTQALIELGIPGTGTATDAVCIVSTAGSPSNRAEPIEPEPFGGPRSRWGSRLARAVHAAVAAGTVDSLDRIDQARRSSVEATAGRAE